MSDDRNFNQCNDLPPIDESANIDQPLPPCNRDEPNQQNANERPDLAWLDTVPYNQLSGLGKGANSDPMLKGWIINPKDVDPNQYPQYSYQYTRALRGADEAVKDLFSDVVVIDSASGVHKVPILWATQEKAVAAVMQANVRKDNSLVVDRIPLPIMAIHSKQFTWAPNRYVYHQAIDNLRWLRSDGKPGFTQDEKGLERSTIFGVARGLPIDIGYTLYVWTLFKEDMNQIVEQVMQKIAPMGYIRVRGVYWEVPVKLDSVLNNEESEPGDKKIRVIKWQFNMTAQTYIPQPIQRKKAVLKTRIELVDGLKEEEITEVIARLEDSVKELEC